MERKALGMAAVVLAVGAAGCGGSGALTTAELRKQANAVCLQAAKQKLGRGGLNEQFVAYQRAKVAGMRELTPPAELRDKYDEFNRIQVAMREAFEEYLALPPKARAGRALEVKTDRLYQRNRALTAALGFKTCKI